MRLSDAEVAVAAADAGAAIVRARFGTSLERFEKAPMDFATDADVDAEHAILEILRAARLADPAFMSTFRPRVLSTTLALAWVAAGRRAGYVTDGRLRDSVHFSSGIALCQAAGCVITGLRGQRLHTGAGGLVAAADGLTHAALIEIIGHQLPGNTRTWPLMASRTRRERSADG